MILSTTYKHGITMAALLVAWFVAIASGARVLLKYSNTPGRIANPPVSWPADVPVGRAGGRSSLLLFAHPECPCSRASVEELARIAACCGDRVESTVLFSIPSGDPMGWSTSGLVQDASRIPGVRVVQDPDGALARRFGARTSGQTLLYDAPGRLTFNGGITALRGHSGDNDGSDAVVSLLLGQSPKHRLTPVFGCALFSEK